MVSHAENADSLPPSASAVHEALAELEKIRTEVLAMAGFDGYATAISAARVALDRALAKPDGGPKTLRGVGIVVTVDGSVQGIVFAPNRERLKDLLQALHGTSISVRLADIRGGTITLEHPPRIADGLADEKPDGQTENVCQHPTAEAP